MISGITYSSKDGTYSESVFYEGADTVTFRVVRGGVGVEQLQNNEVASLQMYPNPTNNQLHITGYALRDSDYSIYNVEGKMIMQGKLQHKATVINVESLANGMYYLKAGGKTVKFVKE